MQGWRNTMEDSHVAKMLDDTPGKILKIHILLIYNNSE